ncbi:MAG TPA: carboxypeptidase regulatory-like domain-containing protein [Bryobacteraceae bacterium]|nr:carboxypeptidase regulatory-like domain-containing protein [Bryobacteraceae bacterium]
MQHLRQLALLLLFLFVQPLGPIVLRAQVDRTAITGTVADQQGNRIPQSRVRTTEMATGFQRETLTTSEGTYELPGLPPGVYSVQFLKTGFASFTAEGVEQLVGQTRTLDVRLELAQGKEQTTVTESLVQLDKVDATIGAAIEHTQVDELPINGRNWATLTALAPGAINNGAGDQRTIRFAGHGLDDNNLTLDGIDATAVYNQEQREYMRLNIPLGSIDEFQVQSQNFGADTQNGTSGGQVTVVSPSGTNSLHGEAFDYFRNNTLDARSPFDGASPDPFLLNQFGVAIGGPIVHDKTFFYADYEGLRQRLDGTQIGLVPSPAFAAQTAVTSPALTPILQAYPAGTSPTSNPNVWNYDAPGRQIDNEDSGMIRFDHYFSQSTTAFVRFNADEAVQTIPTGQVTAMALTDTKFNNGVVELSHLFSPTLINEVKFGVNQTIYHTANLSPVLFGVAVSGLSSLTGSSTTDYPSKTFDLIDDLSWAKGKHLLKLGYETRWIMLNQGTSQSGTLTYTSIAEFIDNSMGSASYTAVLPLVRQRKVQYFGYAQDEWKATPHLTITAGIRYNFFNALHAIGDDDVPFDFGTCGGYCPRTDSFFHPRYRDFDPRLGIAWTHGDTVLRAGGGIYHTDGQEDDQNLPISNTVDRYSFSDTKFPALSYPLTPFLQYAEAGGLGVVSPRDLDRNRKDDYVAAWTASVQHKLPLNILGTASYLGNKGTDVLTTTYTNLINPETGVAPYPAFGPVSWRGDVGNSTFHALQLNVRRAFEKGFMLSANYMWFHSINDDSIGGGESDTPQDSFCRACDKASSDDDVRQMYNLSAVYQLPFGAGRQYLSSPGIARTVFGGWTLSTIATTQTGLPFNITINRSNGSVPGDYAVSGEERPDYVPGVPLTPPGGSTPNDWVNAAAFSTPASGTFGDLGRNAFRAPPISDVDFALAKDVSFTERMHLRFRADVFNVFNRAQYGAPNAVLGQTNFGVITNTISSYATGRGTPREFQLSAKVSF